MSVFSGLPFVVPFFDTPLFLQIFDNWIFYVIIVAAFDESVKSYSGYVSECFTGQYRFYNTNSKLNDKKSNQLMRETKASTINSLALFCFIDL